MPSLHERVGELNPALKLVLLEQLCKHHALVAALRTPKCKTKKKTSPTGITWDVRAHRTCDGVGEQCASVANSKMERVRALFETRDRLELAATEHILRDSKSVRQCRACVAFSQTCPQQQKRVLNQHAAAEAIGSILDVNRQLSAALAEPDVLANVGVGVGSEGMGVFYERLRALKDYHTRFPHLTVPRPTAPGSTAATGETRSVTFSGAERHGRHLDLHEFYDAFVNLKRIKVRREADASFAVSYREYCGSFFEFDDDERHKDAEYLHYLQDLAAYLVDFLRRAQPLLDAGHLVQQIESESEAQWASGAFRSWGGGGGEGAAQGALYCAACETRFAKQGTFDGHLKGKKHAAAAKKLAATGGMPAGGGGGGGGGSLRRAVFLHEVRVNRLADSLADVIQATIADIEKKQSRTLREQLDAMEEDSEEQQEEDGAGDEEEDEAEEQGFVKQIKNYPVGWDGEPIPYWLYRLHGLGVEYKCEICGNTSYWGRRAFEKHFEEFRHQNGMKLLGLPNTAHFFEIVRIKDAVELHRKLEADKARAWRPEEEMEMEDDQGRVYDRKTYELLRQQGIIRDKKQ
jgi:splicing factor 3A subunit 3